MRHRVFPTAKSTRSTRLRRATGLIILAGAFVGSFPGTVSATSVPPPEGKAWQVVLDEEFNGSSLDTTVWSPYHSTYGDGNRELQCSTPANIDVSDGTLKITAKRETVTCPGGSTRSFTSGFLGTRETGTFFPRYGHFEIRVKVPHGQGLWPAFWLRHRNGATHTNGAEVDIMEYFHSQRPGAGYANLHLSGETGSLNHGSRYAIFEAPTAEPGWHTWAVSILPENENDVRFRFYLNGEEYLTHLDHNPQYIKEYPGEGIWDIAVNMAVGGNWAGHPDDPLGYLRPNPVDHNPGHRCAISGQHNNGINPNCAIARSSHPDWTIQRWSADSAVYEVDYVRVHELVDAPSGDVTPPEITMITPEEGESVAGIKGMGAETKDDVGVVRVKYYLNGNGYDDLELGNTTNPGFGYGINWDTRQVPDGTYTVRGEAFDAAGNVGTSAPVTVHVRNTQLPDNPPVYSSPPSEGITPYEAPPQAQLIRNTGIGYMDHYTPEGEKVSGNAVMTWSLATDAAFADSITKVEYWVDGRLHDTLTDAPFSLDTTTVANGWRTIEEKIHHTDGSTAMRTTPVYIDNPTSAPFPVAATITDTGVSYAESGRTLSGQTSLSWRLITNERNYAMTVEKVIYSVDGVKVVTFFGHPYPGLDSSRFFNGWHTIREVKVFTDGRTEHREAYVYIDN